MRAFFNSCSELKRSPLFYHFYEKDYTYSPLIHNYISNIF